MGNFLKDIIKQKVRKLALAIHKSTQRGYFTESMSAYAHFMTDLCGRMLWKCK